MNKTDAFKVAERTYTGKIKHFARLHHLEFPGWSPSDLEQELLTVLWKVVETYNPDNGARFNTYFWQCAQNRYKDLLKRTHAFRRQSEWFDSYDAPVTDESGEELEGQFGGTEHSAEDWAIAFMEVRELAPIPVSRKFRRAS